MKVKCAWSGVACNNRSCESAPLALKTIDDCDNYLSGCVVAKDGGCTTATNCVSIAVAAACIKDKNNNPCFW